MPKIRKVGRPPVLVPVAGQDQAINCRGTSS
jgi:hypothetical protein